MSKSFKGGEGRQPFDRGVDKRNPLKSLEDLGNFFPHTGMPVRSPDNEGSKSPEPLSTLPDYSGNEATVAPREEEVKEPEITEIPFDPTNYRVYAKKSFEIIRDYRRDLAPDIKKYLNGDEQNLFNELEAIYQELNRQNPGSWEEAKRMIGKIDDLRGRYFGLEQRIDAEKERDIPLEDEVAVPENKEAAIPTVSVITPTAEMNKPEAKEIKSEVPVSQNPPKTEEKFKGWDVPVRMVDYQPVTYKTSNENVEKPTISYSLVGKEVSFAESDNSNNEAKADAVSPELPTDNNKEMAGNSLTPEKTEVGSVPEKNPEEIDAVQFEKDLNEHLNGSPNKEKTFDPNSLSAIKLRETTPGITDEQIKTELERRHQNFREFLRNRKDLKESFLPYRESKNKYNEVYKNQLVGGYDIYKKTNWLGKMFGFNPKNLNSLAIAERQNYASFRLVYRERLEEILGNKLANSKEYSDLIVAEKFNTIFTAHNMIKAAMTDRFLLRPARETLKLQNEIFPETNRKNIISKFKAVIKANPKVAAAIGAVTVGGTIATGGLAAIVPMAFGMGGAAMAGVLSTKFGVNKSERGLSNALKNAQLGFTADDLVEAEIKLLTAHQDVEISKNRRDVYTTIGGVVGGGFGADLAVNGSESILGKIYESLTFTSPIEDAPVVPPEILTPEVPPTTDGPRVVLPDPQLETTPPELMVPEPATPEIPVTPDTPGTPVPPDAVPLPEAPNEVDPAPEGESELEADPEEEEIFPETPESLGNYVVQSGDNFWNIMEGQTEATQPPTLEWMKENNPENYQALIDLVRDVGNSDAGVREMLGFGESMDDLNVGRSVDLGLLEDFANKIAEQKGWIDHELVDTTTVPEPVIDAINKSVKEYFV